MASVEKTPYLLVLTVLIEIAYLEIVLYKHLLGGYLISLKIPVVGENAPNIVKLALTTNHAILPLFKNPLIYFCAVNCRHVFEIHFLVNPAKLHLMQFCNTFCNMI